MYKYNYILQNLTIDVTYSIDVFYARLIGMLILN